VTAAGVAPPPFAEVEGGKLRLNFHPGQRKAWESEKRIVAVIAGTQSGKSAFGPHWLYREIQRRGPGDYFVVTPTFAVANLKVLPSFLHVFDSMLWLGRGKGYGYNGSSHVYKFSPDGSKHTFGSYDGTPTQVFFGHAANPDSLESATVKAAWLDEAGQNAFKVGSWQAIRRRIAVHQARVLITTTPFNLGWLKEKIHDPAKRAGGDHPEIDLFRFDSTENPAFPPEEYERARRDMPRWLFDMFYRGIFTRPAGLIYENFDNTPSAEGGTMRVPRYTLPAEWPRYVGMDFGARNTAAISAAAELDANRARTGRLIVYREHHPAERWKTADHVRAIREGEPRTPTCVGGNPNEHEWRDEFAKAGLPVSAPPVGDVEVGISAVFGMIGRGELLVMDDLEELLDELATYSRQLKDNEPTEQIEDKATYHLLDALRYLVVWLKGGSSMPVPRQDPRGRGVIANAPPGVWG
jgi:hypothetical protein